LKCVDRAGMRVRVKVWNMECGTSGLSLGERCIAKWLHGVRAINGGLLVCGRRRKAGVKDGVEETDCICSLQKCSIA